MNEAEKLRVLIPHWMEHNQEHAQEYRRWAEGAAEASGDLLGAVEALKDANRNLALALEKLGGGTARVHSH